MCNEALQPGGLQARRSAPSDCPPPVPAPSPRRKPPVRMPGTRGRNCTEQSGPRPSPYTPPLHHVEARAAEEIETEVGARALHLHVAALEQQHLRVPSRRLRVFGSAPPDRFERLGHANLRQRACRAPQPEFRLPASFSVTSGKLFTPTSARLRAEYAFSRAARVSASALSIEPEAKRLGIAARPPQSACNSFQPSRASESVNASM